MKQLANMITVSRILITPFVVWGILVQKQDGFILASLLFLLASLTDLIDGWIARSLKQTSNFGAVFDPIADKILVTSTLTVLAVTQIISIWPVLLFFIRDSIIGGVRTLASLEQRVIAAMLAGKTKTVMQMIAIPLLILEPTPGVIWLPQLGNILLWISVGFSLISGTQYVFYYLKR
ncbi:MAG: CDP-diacylglycerol--glycerol-3-phosphate 3-phosphatidyltransferase [Bdellovibrionaceae bacterium]|nr:CDP-diacylglycerol--glycerol-3-phosphate 3-phosphatidyltransferase [Pseudobdellovibrionaceae bacterium]MDW8191287.1 CDP-diacylglycerol--glycerol-3-phosphate 3-phosphatidyltransferase [Pseudobdellovibrionaceae bacterium]